MSGEHNQPSMLERFARGLSRAGRRVNQTLWPAMRIGVAAGRRLAYQGITTTSSHLSFLTMFGLVPVLVLTVAIMRPLGLLENVRGGLHQFLTNTGISTIEFAVQQPGAAAHTTTVNLAGQIEKVVREVLERLTVERVGPVGVLVLAWAAISLVTTLEKALNSIFGIRQTRPLGQRFLLYWSVVTLCPITLAAVIYPAGKAIEEMKAFSYWATYILGGIAYVAPTIVGIFIVAMLYKFLPNTYVQFRAALVGALVAVPIWVVAKNGFEYYLRYVMVSGNIYGVLGLLPVFLVWLNMSWLIFLWGAQLAHATQHGGRVWIERPGEDEIQRYPSDLLAVTLAVARYFQAAMGAIAAHELARNVALPEGQIRELLQFLESNDIVIRIEEQGQRRYLLARPAEKIPVLEILGVSSRHGMEFLTSRYNTRTATAVLHLQDQAMSGLGHYTLADLLAQERLAVQDRREQQRQG